MSARRKRTRDGWADEARTGAIAARRAAQAQHDAAVAGVIRTCRAAGLSWRQIAGELTAEGWPTPRRAAQTQQPGVGGKLYQMDLAAVWDVKQVRRIAVRLGIE